MTGRIPPEGGDLSERQIIRRMLAVAAFLVAMFLVLWAVLSFGGVR